MALPSVLCWCHHRDCDHALRVALGPDVLHLKTVRCRARRVLGRKLRLLETDDAQLLKTRAGEIARIVDVTEKHHGTGQDESNARMFKDRLQGLEALQRILGAQATPPLPGPGESAEQLGSGDDEA